MRDKIIDKLKSLGYPITFSGGDYILTKCLNPQHIDKNPSFSLNLTTGFGHCFSCGYKVTSEWFGNDEVKSKELTYSLLKQFKNRSKECGGKSRNIILPPKGKELFEVFGGEYRGIPTQYLKDKLNVYICTQGKYKNRVIFPFINVKGEVEGFTARALGDETPKYLHSKGFNSTSIVYPQQLLQDNKVVLVEGVMDTITLNYLGISSISNFGVSYKMTKSRANTLLSLGVEEIIPMFDLDKKGQEAEINFFKTKSNYKYFKIIPKSRDKRLLNFLKSGCKDVNEYIMKGYDVST